METIRQTLDQPTPYLAYEKIVGNGLAVKQVQDWQMQGETVAITDVVCDILHYRHFEYFAAIKRYVDRLLVRVDTDELVATKKDSKGPIAPLEYRLKALAHLSDVDLLTTKHKMGLDWVDIYKPDVIFKSTTSGVKVVQEIAELQDLNHKPQVLVFDQDNNLVSPDNVLTAAKWYEDTKYGDDKFSGSIIKQEIQERYQERLAHLLTCNLPRYAE